MRRERDAKAAQSKSSAWGAVKDPRVLLHAFVYAGTSTAIRRKPQLGWLPPSPLKPARSPPVLKYLPGVAPVVRRNISMNALTLS